MKMTKNQQTLHEYLTRLVFFHVLIADEMNLSSIISEIAQQKLLSKLLQAK